MSKHSWVMRVWDSRWFEGRGYYEAWSCEDCGQRTFQLEGRRRAADFVFPDVDGKDPSPCDEALVASVLTA